MTDVVLERDEIQGLFARGYSNLSRAAFLLVGLDGATGGGWLQDLLGTVTSADDRPDKRALNVAFTSAGLERLGVDRATLAGFSTEFVSGMTAPHRQRILADAGASAPERWDWGAPTAEPVHAILLLYGRDADALAEVEAEQAELLGRHGARVIRRLETNELDGFEPFGFRDGVSQPLIEGLGKTGPRELTVRAGEFVLGYPNEYGRLTDHPPLGRNGSYLVFRQLEQDVRGFWRFLDETTRRRDGTADAAERNRLGAKLVGRWPSGAPLTLAPDADDAALGEENDFQYHKLDARGARCPVGAHIRRANPRDSLDPRPGSERSLEINRRHRLLRRGREYGSTLSVDDALAGRGGDEPRGLHFICLNANIARQFEFVQHTWLNNPKFDGLFDDADPLVGPSEPWGGTFTAPSEGVRQRFTGVPRFITVRGGAYFFLPSMSALRALAQGEPGKVSSPVGS